MRDAGAVTASGAYCRCAMGWVRRTRCVLSVNVRNLNFPLFFGSSALLVKLANEHTDEGIPMSLLLSIVRRFPAFLDLKSQHNAGLSDPPELQSVPWRTGWSSRAAN